MTSFERLVAVITIINSLAILFILFRKIDSNRFEIINEPTVKPDKQNSELDKKLLEYFGDFANFCVFREVKYEIADMTENQISQIKGYRKHFSALVILKDKSNIIIKSPNDLLFVRHKYTNYYFMYDHPYEYVKDVELKIRAESCER